MPSGPAASPFFGCFSARSISALDGGLTLSLCRGPSLEVVFGISVGGDLSRMSRKCSTHFVVCSCSVVMVTPSLLLVGFDWLLLFPDIVVVMSHRLFMFRCPAALSAYVARVLKNSFLSFLALFVTSRCTEVMLLFLARSLHLPISTFKRFVCVIRIHVSAESHSFCVFFLLIFPELHPRTTGCVSVLSSDCLCVLPQTRGLNTYSLLSS